MKYLLKHASVMAMVCLLAACAALPPSGGGSKRPAAIPPPAQPSQRPPPQQPQQPHSPQPSAPAPVETLPPHDPALQPPAASAPPPVSPVPQPPAVVALLDNAGRQEKSGKLEAAATTLERAVRVDPRNPLVWHRLARVRLAQEQWKAAANMATKSNSLAGGDVALQRRNWSLIAEARQRMGDSAGARAARAKATR